MIEVVSSSTILSLAQLARPRSPRRPPLCHHYLLSTASSQAEAVIQAANAIMQLPSDGTMATQLDRIASFLR